MITDTIFDDGSSMKPDGMSATSYRRAQRIYVAERRARVTELLRKRMSVMEIVRATGLPQSTVSEDVAWQLAEWKRMATADLALFIAEELESINRRERVAWEAYEKSCQQKKIGIVHTSAGVVSASGTAIERLEGDARFLAEARHCSNQRMKLLGMGGAGINGRQKVAEKVLSTLEDFVAEEYRRRRQEKNVTPTPARELPGGES